MSNITSVPAPSHLASLVYDIAAVRVFYGDILGCLEGRSSPNWVDLDFYGHQIVARLASNEIGHHKTSAIDGDNVPVRHFGVVLSMPEQEAIVDKLCVTGIKSITKPHIRFKGEMGKQATMLLLDPLDDAMGIKVFANMASLFAK